MKLIIILSFSLLYGLKYPFNIGETLKYKASFSGIPAGIGTLKIINEEIIQNKNTFHIQFQAKTNGFTNFIFPINDIIDVWIDKKTLMPIQIRENISEGNYKRTRYLEIFQNKGYAIINEKDIINYNTKIHSVYSLFYFFRVLELSTFNKKSLKILKGNSVEDLEINIENGININSQLGNFICTKVVPQKKNLKKFKNESTITIWFSNDKKKYPIQIWLKMKYGSLMLELNEIIN